MDGRFVSKGADILNFGMTSSAVWLRFSLSASDANGPVDRVIDLESPYIDHADLYVPASGGGFRIMENGTTVAFSRRPEQGLNLAYPIRIEPGQTVTCYMRLVSDKTILINLLLWSRDGYFLRDRQQSDLLTLFAGMLVMIALYNLLVFASIRDRNYLYLAAFTAVMGFYALTQFGLAPMYVWPESPRFARIAAPLFAGLSMFVGAQFGRRFLMTARFARRTDLALRFLAGAGLVLVLLTFVQSFYANVFIAYFAAATFALALAACVIRLRAGYAPARYTLVAVAISMTGGLLNALMVFGVLGWNALTTALGPVFFIVAAVVLTMSLGERIRWLEISYRAVYDAATDAILLFDPQTGAFADSNRAARELFGYSADDWTARSLADLFDGEPPTVGHALVSSPGDPPNHTERVVRRAGGETFWCETTLSALPMNGQTMVLVALRDITARKRAEEERARTEQQRRQSQKMEAIGRLAGGVAHDFNNLLTGINTNADLVLTSLDKATTAYEDVAEIRRAGQRAAELTGQLLAFSRKQPIVPRVLDLNAAIERSKRMVTRIMGEDIQIAFKPDADLRCIRMDPAQLDQILLNLAVNARDVMPEGGRLLIETANATADDVVGIDGAEQLVGDLVLLSVSDNGKGMDAVTRSHIFEPFFTTKEKGRGTGLGLATVYGIVKQNGAAIDVQSEPGAGTTFRVFVPAVEERIESPSMEPEQGLPTGTETVLVVEDEDMIRVLVERILRGQGYRVLTARGGADALMLCEEVDGEIDLLLTDVVMPYIDGRELYVALHAVRPGMKVLFMSGYTEDVIAQHGILEDGSPLLTKPFSVHSLVLKVREVFDA